ncbi:MAG: methyltransferase domain-containing protein [Bacteroidia bacterium]|nr:methyltransferase domain-containing protein [Bacteroidia bacterium]
MPWYKEWFNSPYYHKLYGGRDKTEAEQLVSNLLDFFNPDSKAVFLDLACGKGRHARQIANRGFVTYGVDLSSESILAARSEPLINLTFDVHDMRQVYKANTFDYIFNLFTSFGYFDSENDTILTLNSVNSELKSQGIFVQDYFNANKVIHQLVPHELKSIDGIDFEIEKHIADKRVYKSIKFKDQGYDYRFCEQVSLYTLDDFKSFYKQTGFEILHVFGDYNLGHFNELESDRLILVSKKSNS